LKLIFSRYTIVHFLVLSEQNIARFVVGSSVLIVIDRPQIAQRTEDDHLLSSDQVRRRGRVGLFVGTLPAFERRVRKGEIAFGARLQFGNLAAKQVSGTRARRTQIETGLVNDRVTDNPFRYLNWTVGGDSVIRKQDAVTVFYSVASGDVGYYVAKDFLYSKIADISD